MKRIFLVGYMGAGKTTVGRELAKQLSLSFLDLDIFIENRFNKTVNELFSELGEERFRILEKNILEEVSSFEDVIIATGGGTPCFFDNINIMLSSGLVIYLKTESNILFKRLKAHKNKRPLIREKDDTELLDFIVTNMKNREYYYNKSHHIFESNKVENSRDLEESVEMIIDIIGN